MVTLETIVDAINQKTQVFFIDAENTTLENVKVRDSGKWNTQAMAVTRVGGQIVASRRVIYNRTDIGKASLVPMVEVEGTLTLADNIDEIRDQTGLPLEIATLTLSDTTIEGVKVIRATANNPGFIGSIELIQTETP